ncbi:MAG TPA: hypothetical protein VLT33_04885 [Labilithrix sp.]|nr:hypothetical protein [Labilithrix sp.]
MRFRPLFAGVFLSSAAVLALGVAACSSDGGGNGTRPEDAGADTSIGPVGTNESKQKGRIIDAIDKFGVAGATVSIAGKTALTKDDGTYEIVVPRNTPYTMSVTASEHYKLNEQEWIVKTELFDRTDTSLLSTSIANLLASFLPPRDAAKGLLVVKVNPLPPCDSEQGSTLSIEPAGTSKVTYFAAGKPSTSATSAAKGEAFSAAFSDVDVGVAIKVTVNSPTCEQVPFPIDYQDVTYTGVQKTEPGEVLSYIRVFIGPKKVGDAGTD